MSVYQLISLLVVIILPFIPVQIDPLIGYLMGIYVLFLFPLFIKNLAEDLRKKNVITIFFILFLISVFLSAIFSIDQKGSVLQFLLYCFYFIVFISIRRVFSEFKSKEHFASTLVLVTFFLSLISLYNTVILHYVNKAQEGVSFMWIYFGHNHLSALLIFSLPLCFSLLIKHKKNLFLLFFIVLLVSFLFSFGIGSILSLIIVGSLALVFFNKIINKRTIIILGTLLTCIVIVFLYGMLPQSEELAGKNKNARLSVQGKLIYWNQALDTIKENKKNFFVGSGLDTFRSINKTSRMKAKLTSYYAHNFFLQMLSDAGIFGFLSSISLIFAVLYKSFQIVTKKLNQQEGFLFLSFWIALLASTLNALVDFDWQLSTVFLIFWMTAGLLIQKNE